LRREQSRRSRSARYCFVILSHTSICLQTGGNQKPETKSVQLQESVGAPG